MNLNEHPQVLAAGLLEAGLLVGVVAVGVGMRRLGVNGPCRLCLALLLAWRVCTAALAGVQRLDAGYFAALVFAYVFLYAIHHLAILVHEVRRRRSACGQHESPRPHPACEA
jgi:hypothetical protein